MKRVTHHELAESSQVDLRALVEVLCHVTETAALEAIEDDAGETRLRLITQRLLEKPRDPECRKATRKFSHLDNAKTKSVWDGKRLCFVRNSNLQLYS